MGQRLGFHQEIFNIKPIGERRIYQVSEFLQQITGNILHNHIHFLLTSTMPHAHLWEEAVKKEFDAKYHYFT